MWAGGSENTLNQSSVPTFSRATGSILHLVGVLRVANDRTLIPEQKIAKSPARPARFLSFRTVTVLSFAPARTVRSCKDEYLSARLHDH